MFNAEILRRVRFKLLDLWPQNELPGFQHAVDGSLDLCPNGLILGLEIEDGHLILTHANGLTGLNCAGIDMARRDANRLLPQTLSCCWNPCEGRGVGGVRGLSDGVRE